jgi:hypothetical protein
LILKKYTKIQIYTGIVTCMKCNQTIELENNLLESTDWRKLKKIFLYIVTRSIVY